MSNLYVFIAEIFFDLTAFFEGLAIGKPALAAYQKAIREPTRFNLDQAYRHLAISFNRINNKQSIAASNLTKCIGQIQVLMQVEQIQVLMQERRNVS